MLAGQHEFSNVNDVVHAIEESAVFGTWGHEAMLHVTVAEDKRNMQ
jgi:hypothetical protein